MRCLGVLVALGACGEGRSPTGDVPLTLEIARGVLEPRGYTSVELVLHTPTGDIRRSTNLVGGGGGDAPTTAAFDALEFAGTRVAIEATLRNDSGAAVGYGRTAVDTTLAVDAPITVQVRRPIAYIAGRVTRGIVPATQRWSEAPATFADLSVGTRLDGRTQVGTQPAVLMIAAGPNLYQITQAVTETGTSGGELIGPARIVPISAADHQAGTALPGSMSGMVIDGAGADNGTTVVVATRTQLFAVDASGARALADGNFGRVAVVTDPTGDISAIAVKNRGTCAASELWWVPVSAATAAASTVGPPQMVSIGGFCDIAADRGRVYFVDAVKGELGEVIADEAGKMVARSIGTLPEIAGTTGGRPTALAVSNGKAYIGIESAPATTSLLVVSTGAGLRDSDEPRTLWSEAAQQVVRATDFPGVLRQLDAASAAIAHIEIGAGGDYVALTTNARFVGDRILEAGFPRMAIDTEELRVFDASTGAVVQRYRSWCAGSIGVEAGDIADWACAAAAGQTAAARDFDHRIDSMTFLFGKK